jgi:MoxR-like ATPase
MLKVLVGYPEATEEFVIVERMTGALQPVQKVLTTAAVESLQQEAARVYVDPVLIEYAVRMVAATRTPGDYGLKELEHYIIFGASPRASINLILTARALAYSCAAAAMPFPRTSETWPTTSCAIASCCPTRRCRTTSAATIC